MTHSSKILGKSVCVVQTFVKFSKNVKSKKMSLNAFLRGAYKLHMIQFSFRYWHVKYHFKVGRRGGLVVERRTTER